jgi:anti-sigma factor RsiW
MATTKRVLEPQPSDLELLLPWHAAGTLNARDARRVEDALARDPELARQYAMIGEEYAATIGLNENLGTPSIRAMQKLFAAIDAEPARRPDASLSLIARLTRHFAKLSPRALAWLAGLAAAALLVQAAVTGVVLVKRDHTATQRSASVNEAAGRFSGSGPRTLVRFAPDARVAEITAVLGRYRASIIDATNDGMFRLQFGDKPMTKDEVADLLGRLQHEKTISLVAMP